MDAGHHWALQLGGCQNTCAWLLTWVWASAEHSDGVLRENAPREKNGGAWNFCDIALAFTWHPFCHTLGVKAGFPTLKRKGYMGSRSHFLTSMQAGQVAAILEKYNVPQHSSSWYSARLPYPSQQHLPFSLRMPYSLWYPENAILISACEAQTWPAHISLSSLWFFWSCLPKDSGSWCIKTTVKMKKEDS